MKAFLAFLVVVLLIVVFVLVNTGLPGSQQEDVLADIDARLSALYVDLRTDRNRVAANINRINVRLDSLATAQQWGSKVSKGGACLPPNSCPELESQAERDKQKLESEIADTQEKMENRSPKNSSNQDRSRNARERKNSAMDAVERFKDASPETRKNFKEEFDRELEDWKKEIEDQKKTLHQRRKELLQRRDKILQKGRLSERDRQDLADINKDLEEIEDQLEFVREEEKLLEQLKRLVTFALFMYACVQTAGAEVNSCLMALSMLSQLGGGDGEGTGSEPPTPPPPPYYGGPTAQSPPVSTPYGSSAGSGLSFISEGEYLVRIDPATKELAIRPGNNSEPFSRFMTLSDPAYALLGENPDASLCVEGQTDTMGRQLRIRIRDRCWLYVSCDGGKSLMSFPPYPCSETDMCADLQPPNCSDR